MKTHKTIKKQKREIKFAPTDTNAGVNWLHSLDEAKFRDDILEHLFRKMKKQGAILGYQNIHGRSDKGVDYLVSDKTIFGSRIIGIQAKSKPISRSEGSSTLSSIRIKQECDAAMEHSFTYEKARVRLDNIELWCSNHVTEDAIQEFNASASKNKIQIKTESAIYTLIETFCPDLIQKIPECALALYVKEKQNPRPHSFKLLGRRLHPEKHFIEPEFSTTSSASLGRLVTKDKSVAPKSENIKIDQIILSEKNIILEGTALSGKSYLLERVSWLIATSGKLPVALSVDILKDKRKLSIWQLVANELGFLNIGEAEAIAAQSKIYVLIDNIDRLKDDQIGELLDSESPNLKIISTATRHISTSSGVEVLYLAGIKKESIPLFLRALDIDNESVMPFTDRAYAFITRSLEHSGLPLTPFTFSIMLGECENTKLRFTTPTFGRLIQRFVEHQLGSLSELNIRVDYETKRAFLLRLSGERAFSFTLTEFRKRLIRFIEHSSHPHAVNDFYMDLMDSGVFTTNEGVDRISWSHPVIKQFFFVQNLIKHDKQALIFKKLIKQPDMTFASLVGSQLVDASKLIKSLLHEMDNIPPIKESDLFNLVKIIGLNFLPDEEQENALLERIERAQSTSDLVDKQPRDDLAPEVKLTSVDRQKMQEELEPLLRQLFEGRYFIAHNIAALLVNARDTQTDLKAKCVHGIVSTNANFVRLFMMMLKKIAPKIDGIDFFLALFASMCQFHITDSHLGDPFLLPIFNRLIAKPANDDEHLMMLDLALGCGENVNSKILLLLKKIDRMEVTMAVYYRVALLYFFRFHREKDKRSLRQLLKDIRRTHKSVSLPTPI